MDTAYALKDGNLVHISEVARGLKCACKCPSCDSTLIARKGEIREHHFAHPAGVECRGAVESLLHLLAKEIIASLHAIEVPEHIYKRSKTFPNGQCVSHKETLAKGGRVRIDQVRVEPKYLSFQPDVEIRTGDKVLLVEVAFTHKVDSAKRRAVRASGMPMIEIVLNAQHALASKQELTAVLAKSVELKRWVYHPREDEAAKCFYTKYREVSPRYSRKKQRKPTPAYRPLTDRANVGPVPVHNGIGWEEANEIGERFFRRHGRYPSLMEAQALLKRTRRVKNLW